MRLKKSFSRTHADATLPCHIITFCERTRTQRNHSFNFITFRNFVSGLSDTILHKELLRRLHAYDPNILTQSVLEAIKPGPEERHGASGVISSFDGWETTQASARQVIFNVYVSSDSVAPFKTDASSVRCVMGSLHSVESPHLGISVPIPDSPPFFISVYKGANKKDDIVLQRVVDEFLDLSPSNLSDGKEIYCRATAWLADAQEREHVCGTLSSSGFASCSKCTMVGTRAITVWQKENLTDTTGVTNGTYFPDVVAPPRRDADWNKYMRPLGDEVIFT